ncbi:MAG TPA: glycosyl hydrolase, partial [Pseudosphingobacterium sp.]|nr:glycosyl hydrolase [Pseudosphingobacterium sp.]
MIYFLLLLKGVEAQEVSRNFVWGINGHPLTQHDYQPMSWDDQMGFLKDLNVHSYRFDVLLNQEGGVRNEAAFFDFLKLLKTNGRSAMPVLMFPGNELQDSASIYKVAFNQGRNFGIKYGKLINVLEIGNELELRILKEGDGTRASQYDLSKSSRLMFKLKGIIDGLKSVSPLLKTSISLGWTHLYYLELLALYKVNYDIIGYHWYSNMGDITNVKAPYGNILQKVKRKYNKTIWITEFNTYEGTRNTLFEKQESYILTSIQKILRQNIVEAFFIYELFDEPALKGDFPH